jgi:hypothetical protein
MKTKKPTLKKVEAVRCPTCGAARAKSATSAQDSPVQIRIVIDA